MRHTDPTTGIDILGTSINTPITRQIDKFWAPQENKKNVQLLVRDIVCNRAYSNITIIASSVVSNKEVIPAISSCGEEVPEILNWIEEMPHCRLVVHLEWAVRVKLCQRIVVVSNDTDTFAFWGWENYGNSMALVNIGAYIQCIKWFLTLEHHWWRLWPKHIY